MTGFFLRLVGGCRYKICMGASAKKIGKYILYDLVARGGMAEVYRGKMVGAAGFEKRVAIKRILADFAASGEFQRMFLSEAQIMASLVHANIVQVTDFFRENDELLLVMDFIFGRNLRELLKKTQEKGVYIPIPIVLHLIIKTAEALDYAHRKVDDQTGKSLGIIHRDVSPQNIMLSFDGEAKIVDFGIAKLASSAEKTQTGVLKGKFGYMSPEQIEGLTLDYRSDIFSLGVVLYESLVGQKLFQADTEVQVIKLIQTFRPPRVASLRPQVSEELEKVLHKMLEKDRVKRFQSAIDVAGALVHILMHEYGGCTTLACSEYLKDLFADEYEMELRQMRALSALHVVEQIPEVKRAATGTDGAVTQIKQHQQDATVLKMDRSPQDQYYAFKLGDGIRFKVELDPGRSWGSVTKEDMASQDAESRKGAQDRIEQKSVPKRQSLLLELWKDPKKRRWLIIGGAILVMLLLLLQGEPEEKPAPEQPQTADELTQQPSAQDEGGPPAAPENAE